MRTVKAFSTEWLELAACVDFLLFFTLLFYWFCLVITPSLSPSLEYITQVRTWKRFLMDFPLYLLCNLRESETCYRKYYRYVSSTGDALKKNLTDALGSAATTLLTTYLDLGGTVLILWCVARPLLPFVSLYSGCLYCQRTRHRQR